MHFLLSVSQQTEGFSLPPALSLVRFSSLLHSHTRLCTGSAQRAIRFELQPRSVPMHSLSRES